MIREADASKYGMFTQKMYVKSNDVYLYMTAVRRTLLFGRCTALDILDDTKWLPVFVTSVFGKFEYDIEKVINSEYPVIANMAKGRRIIWLPEWLINNLREDGHVSYYDVMTLGEPIEVKIFYEKGEQK